MHCELPRESKKGSGGPRRRRSGIGEMDRANSRRTVPAAVSVWVLRAERLKMSERQI